MSPITAGRLAACTDALRLAVEEQPSTVQGLRELQRTIGEEESRLVAASAQLQTKAREKFGPGLWWVTERALQQSTAMPIAQVKSHWLGHHPIHDLCCGLGGDAIAMAGQGHDVVAIDSDAALIAMAHANAELNATAASSRLRFHCGDVRAWPLPEVSMIHVDPDRRTDGRTTRPQDYSPDWSEVLRMIDRSHGALVKVAPAASFDAGLQAHRSWISLSGSVREQTLIMGDALETAGEWFGESIGPNSRSAVCVSSRDATSTFVAHPEAKAPAIEAPQEFLVDLDPAIRAAGLTDAFACRHELSVLGSASGFLTCKHPPESSMAVCEQVIWKGASDDRRLRKTLRSMNAHPWRVKTRGVDADPNQLEKRYRECGEQPVTLWIGRAGKRRYAAITTALQP